MISLILQGKTMHRMHLAVGGAQVFARRLQQLRPMEEVLRYLTTKQREILEIVQVREKNRVRERGEEIER